MTVEPATEDWLILPEQFCDSPFWDGNLTLNSSWPQFTDCFQKVALTGGPCALLWVTSLIYGYFLMTSKDDLLPTGKLFNIKMACCTLLAAISIWELTWPEPDLEGPLIMMTTMDIAQFRLTADTCAPLVLLLTVMLSGVLSRLEHQKGLRSSAVLFVFWSLLTLCQIVPLYTLFMDQMYVSKPLSSALFLGKFTLIVCLVVLHSLAEASTTLLSSEDRKPCPDIDAPLWSKLTFQWMQELMSKAKAGEVKEKDIYHLPPATTSDHVMLSFLPTWQREVDKSKRRNHTENPEKETEDPEKLLDRLLKENKTKKKRIKLRRVSSLEESSYKRSHLFSRCQSEIHPTRDLDYLLQGDAEVQKETDESSEEGKEESKKSSSSSSSKSSGSKKVGPNLLVAMIRCFGLEFAIIQLVGFLRTALEMTEPVLFGLFLAFMEDAKTPLWRGYAICALMVFIKIIHLFLKARHDFSNHSFAIRIRNSIVNSVFRKALTMDTESRQESTVGQAVNLMSVDTGEINAAFTWMASQMIFVPVKILAALFMLYQVLGSAMLISVVMLAVMVPINSVVARKLSGFHRKQMDLKDERLKILTEVINGAKILKMYAWEPSFIDKVNDARKKELDILWWHSIWDTCMHFYWAVSPYMVSITVFMMYVYLSEDHYLAPSVVFVAISLLDILKGNMGTVPHVINHFIKVTVSFKRLNEFLGRNDLDDNITSDEEDAVSIKSGFFTWSSGSAPTLKNINLSVKKGSLVAVVGTVGCGKSSLLSAYLGEMKKLKGKVSIKGSVAYVPQQAWIQHATLKDNVLFGQDLDEGLYQRCLDDCALRTDLDILPGGDMTEIGEKGINLSGGQKQRVSLARAAYSQADVYLLDDPLSAVDCHVGSHIFDKVLGHQGMLAGKTRVLVTHGVQWLPKVDRIVVVRHGRVSETGSYEELLTHNGPFAKFLKSYLVHHAEADSDPMMEKMKVKLLHRLESLPSSVKSSSSVTEDRDLGTQSGSEGGSSSSSDNEAIIQDMLRSISQEPPPEDAEEEKKDLLTEESPSKEKTKEEDRNKEKTTDKKADGKLVEDEEYQVQQVKWTTLWDYAQLIGLSWASILLTLFTAQQLAERAGDLALSQWTDDAKLANLTELAKDSEERVSLNNHYLMIYVTFGVIHAITTMTFKTTMLLRKVATARVVHNRMLSRVLRAPMTFFDTTPVGRIVNRFSADLHSVDHDLIHIMEWAGYVLFSVVSRFCIICYVTPTFVFTIIPMVLIFSYTQKYGSPTMRAMERLESKTKAPIYSYFSETLGGTAVVRAFGAQERFMKEFRRRYDLRQAVEFCWGNCNRWLDIRMELMSCIVMATVVMTAVVSRDVMSAGIVGLAITQAMDITGCLHSIVHMVSWLQTKLISVDRINDYCTMKKEADWRIEETKPAGSWPERGQVEARDLALRYREGLDLVLKGITVKFGAGEKVGIVGRTGAGKSSLTLALFRLIEPAKGEFRIDGVSINDLGLHDLRTRLTILPQDPVIFAGTLRMNLDPFSHFTDEEVWEALRHAHLSDFVQGLKEGLKHECGEGGENLSVGQRQLLCLARTLLHKTRVLVLDEATAAVDMETDDLIQTTIRSEFKDCTVLTIAHRLNTVIDYDKILVLDKGQVVEFDSPSHLMDDPSSIFHDMCKKAGLLHKRPKC